VTRWRIKHVFIAAVLLTIELALGLGMIGVPAVIIAAAVLSAGTNGLACGFKWRLYISAFQ
jgi:hypothetical protein